MKSTSRSATRPHNIFVICNNFQIWGCVDNKQGYLTRTGLYHALALTALAQQGKGVNEKVLEKYSDTGAALMYC